MANTPDINNILAALAARRAAETSTPQAAGFVTHLQSAQLSNPAGLALPKPSNSGSLDLSAIQPVATGSAEALTKARGTADKTLREDPRFAGRGAARRSRSRSPVRNYRDNFNPYRDERRDDRGRGSVGRDRSFSPANGARTSHQPAYGAPQSPPARVNAQEISAEVITVASSSVGLIIGRGGENLRRVEAESGARVQFITGPDNSGPERQCRITGTRQQRADAIADIFRVADESPNKVLEAPARQDSMSRDPPLKEGERTVQIMVPDRTVGLIIGRGGETIRDLQERSGCHVNITAENKSINGLRPVNLIGTREASEHAKQLILEVVESDTRSGGGAAQVVTAQVMPTPYDSHGGAYGGGVAYGGSAAGYSGGGYGVPAGYDQAYTKINDSITVPSDAVGMIIGKGGETIKDMQNNTGCKINVSTPSGADISREIGLIGTRQAIESAKRAIWDKVGTVREKQGGRRDMPYGDPYSQQQQHPQPQPLPQQAYGQPPPMHMPSMPPAGAPEAAAGDPYAAYGGYQAYLAMWYAAFANQQGGQGPPPA